VSGNLEHSSYAGIYIDVLITLDLELLISEIDPLVYPSSEFIPNNAVNNIN